MTSVESTQPGLNGGEDSIIDDGEEAESKVRRLLFIPKLAQSYTGILQEIQLMKERVEEMEREANKLRELQAAAEQASNTGDSGEDPGVPMVTDEEKAASDSKSIYVGNVSIFP